MEGKALYGKIVCDLRKYRGWSLENLSEKLGISKGELSKMERGQRQMPKDLFYGFMQAMQIPWQDHAPELEKKFADFYNKYYYVRKNEAKAVMQDVLEHRLYHRYSLDYFWEILFEYFDSIIYGLDEQAKKNKDRHELCLKSVVFLFPMDVQAMLYDLFAYREWKEQHDGMGIEWRQKAIMLANSSSPGAVGPMIEYHELQFCVDQAKIECFMALYTRIETRLVRDRNFRRLISLDVMKSCVLTAIQEYDKSEQLLKNTSLLLGDLDYQSARRFILDNLVWNALMAGWYEQAIEYILQMMNEFPQTDPYNAVYLPFCYLMLDDSKKAVETLEMLPQIYEIDPFDQKLLQMTEDLAFERLRSFERSSERFLKAAEKYGTYGVVMLVLDLQIRYFEQVRNWQMSVEKRKQKDAFRQNRQLHVIQM